MTFFDKLFTSKNRFFRSEFNPVVCCTRSSDGSPRIELVPEQVRVVLFRECERRGRKLLFDSDAVEKIPADSASGLQNHSEVVEVSPTHVYKYKKPNKDVSSLGEMIFGSVAICTKGVTTKIHSISSPARLLFTTVMPTNGRCHLRSNTGCRGSSGILPGRVPSCQDSSCASDSLLYQGAAVNAEDLGSRPQGLHRSHGSASLRTLTTGQGDLLNPGCCEAKVSSRLLSTCCEDILVKSAPPSRRTSDAPSCSLGSARSFFSSFGSICDSKSSNLSLNSAGGSLSSLRRRWNQSLAVSLDHSSCEESEEVSARVRTKLGIALVLNISGPCQAELKRFLLSNSLTLESILERLREQLVAAYSRLNTFVQLSHEAFEAAVASLLDVVRSRQDTQPRWLRMMSPPSRCIRTAAEPTNLSSRDQFMTAFYGILQSLDAKSTNFFVSTLLTAVLTHNLSWVSSVSANSNDSELRQDIQVGKGSYNPLLAQHSELFGAVTSPSRFAKVVVVDSRNREILPDLLDVLAYFIRFTTVVEHHFEGEVAEITDLEKKHIQNHPDVAMTKPSSDLGEAFDQKWTADENFDSGVDCEMRDAVLLSSLVPETKSDHYFDVLVTSAAERIHPNSLNQTLYPTLTQMTELRKESEFRTGVSAEKPVKCKAEEFLCRFFGKEKKSVRPDVFIPPSKENSKFIDLCASKSSRECCNGLKSSCNHRDGVKSSHPIDDVTFIPNSGSLYPSIDELARLENVRLEDLTSERDRTLFVEEVLQMAEGLPRQKTAMDLSEHALRDNQQKSPTPDEGYDTVHDDSELGKNVLFVLGDAEKTASRTVVTKSFLIEPEPEPRPPRRRKCPKRSRTVNIPVVEGLKILHQRSRTMEDVAKQCSLLPDKDLGSVPTFAPVLKLSPSEEKLAEKFEELPMPCCAGPIRTRVMPVCPVLGGVSPTLHPHHVLQAVTKSTQELEEEIRKSLIAMSTEVSRMHPIGEAVFIVADTDKWSISVHSSQRTTLGTGAPRTVLAAPSQLVADMLESFSNIYCLGLPANVCVEHLERKLGEFYRKSQAVAELLMDTEFCTVDLLTSRLHIAVNDVPLLLSVATTHTPEIAEKYGITFS